MWILITALWTCVLACVSPRKRADATEAQSSAVHASREGGATEIHRCGSVVGLPDVVVGTDVRRVADGTEQSRPVAPVGQEKDVTLQSCFASIMKLGVPTWLSCRRYAGALGPVSDAKMLVRRCLCRKSGASRQHSGLHDASERMCTAMRLWGRWVGEATELTQSLFPHAVLTRKGSTMARESKRHLGVQGFQVHRGCLSVDDRLAGMPHSPVMGLNGLNGLASSTLSCRSLRCQPHAVGGVVSHRRGGERRVREGEAH